MSREFPVEGALLRCCGVLFTYVIFCACDMGIHFVGMIPDELDCKPFEENRLC